MRAFIAAGLIAVLAGCSDNIHYWREKHPRFGTTNPERMDLPFWRQMVKTGMSAYGAQKKFMDRAPKDGPVWTFDRFGMTRTKLPDGTTLCIGGEHEDYYDPNFHIYNDVVALKPGADPEIDGYPESDFPPTDFHTATLVDGDVFLIGALGYPDRRSPGTTPVYRLNVATRRIERFPTSGTPPGWIFRHKAVFDPKRRAIVVSGGQVQRTPDVNILSDNDDEYRLRLADGVWERLTDRHWLQFRIAPKPKRWIDEGKRSVKIDDLLPDMPHALVPAKRGAGSSADEEDAPVVGWTVRDIVVRGVTVHYAKGLHEIDMKIQGSLPAATVSALASDLSAKLGRALGVECRVERL